MVHYAVCRANLVRLSTGICPVWVRRETIAAVSLKELTKHYGEQRVVDRFSCQVPAGKMLALLGPSGCGKTTVLRMVAGLTEPDAGEIAIDGRSMVGIPPQRRGAAMVFQDPMLFPHMTVGQNVGFGLKILGLPRQEVARRVREMLKLVQLPDLADRAVHGLSGGQQQRVALARALVVDPRVLLLDEPLANLDANLRVEMRWLIRQIQQSLGITAIFVTHDQEEAVMVADEVALMMAGRLLQVGSPRQLMERPGSAAVARFFRNTNFLPTAQGPDGLQTALGLLQGPEPGALGPGRGLLTVRPERVSLRPGPGANCLPGRVISVVYMGVFSQLTIDLGGYLWQVIDDVRRLPEVGSTVHLYLPPESIWVLPAED